MKKKENVNFKNHYVKNKDLYNEIIISKDQNEITENLHLMFHDMCKGIISKPNFSYLSYATDMITTAYLKCTHVYKKYDETRLNPFSYFTSVIIHAIYDEIADEKKYFKLKDDAKERFLHLMQIEYGSGFLKRNKIKKNDF